MPPPRTQAFEVRKVLEQDLEVWNKLRDVVDTASSVHASIKSGAP
jgi:hypothetical protein